MRSINLKMAAVVGILAAALYLTPAAWAQNADSVAGTASAKISQVIAIAKTAGAANGGDLNFGEIYSPLADDTVVVSTSGGRTAGTNANILGDATNVSSASFTVTGEPGNSFSISAIADTTIDSGANSMDVTEITPSLAGSGTLTGGTYIFTVGATLHVAANQPAGTYTGTFDITVNYD